jgi:signal transduction histidine kinase/CheY-like chemotaxis protein
VGNQRDADVAGLSRESLEERALALQTVLSIAEAVHQSDRFGDFAERAVDAIVRYTRFAAVAFFRVDPAAAALALVASRGLDAATLDGIRNVPLGGSFTGEAIRLRRVLTAVDVPREARGADAAPVAPAGGVLDHAGFANVASVPILFRDEAVGAMNLVYRDPVHLSEHERFVLMAVGRTLGLVMQDRLAADARRALENQLHRAEQIEHLGALAAGIAHDFNNLLVGILGNISAAREVAGHEAKAVLAEAEASSRRAADLVQRLLTFARGGAPVARPSGELASRIREAVEIAAQGAQVRCEVDVRGELGVLRLDSGQVMQVVQNLVLNAAQASPPGGAVRVRIERGGAPAHLRIVVTDEGQGIAPDVLPRVFEPHFTTRGRSGLGLTVAQSIVRRHGGTIDVTTEPGHGSTFTVTLPAPESAARAAPTDAPSALQVLIVDDEDSVRRTLRRVLTSAGARTVEVEDAAGATAAYREARAGGRPFDCVVLDLTLGGGESGVDVLRRLKEIDPAVRAVVSSGYSDDNALADYERHGFVAVLPKPYTAAEVRAVVWSAAQR